MLSDLIEVIKKAALDAVETQKPVNILFGTVVSNAPLVIEIDQKTRIESDSLILTNAVMEHKIEMSVEQITEITGGGSGESSFAPHAHEYKGRKIFTLHNGLAAGEKVILLRIQGGQKFLVLDRIT